MDKKLKNCHVYKELIWGEHGGEYWMVAFPDLFDRCELANEIEQWCTEQFGPGLVHPLETSKKHRWVNDIDWGEIRFADEKDVSTFLLKWS